VSHRLYQPEIAGMAPRGTKLVRVKHCGQKVWAWECAAPGLPTARYVLSDGTKCLDWSKTLCGLVALMPR